MLLYSRMNIKHGSHTYFYVHKGVHVTVVEWSAYIILNGDHAWFPRELSADQITTQTHTPCYMISFPKRSSGYWQIWTRLTSKKKQQLMHCVGIFWLCIWIYGGLSSRFVVIILYNTNNALLNAVHIKREHIILVVA